MTWWRESSEESYRTPGRL